MDFLLILNYSSNEFLPFILFTVAIFFSLLMLLLLSAFKSNYGFRKRGCFLIFLFSLTIVSKLFLKDTYPLFLRLNFAIIFFFVSIVFTIRVKRKKDVSLERKKQVELARFIEKSVREACEREESDFELVKRENYPTTRSKTDFSYVRKVIKRLGEIELAYLERKMVNELECLLISVGESEPDVETKRKLNDGLGALLKLMAKYHV